MKVPIRAVTVCVDCDDLLALTAPYNRAHFAEHTVVTTPEDTRTREVALRNNCATYLTREFYHRGAEFAKWRALEAALDAVGRHGWVLLLDADVCWPRNATERLADWVDHPRISTLYCPNRRMLERPEELRSLRANGVPPETDWPALPLHHNVSEWAGYSLLVHGDDPFLPKGHWHDTNWRSCGAADSFFQARWPPARKVKLPFEVLHLGSTSVNWYGRTAPYLDGRPAPPEAEERRRLVDGLAAERQRTGFTKERIE